MSKLTDNMNDDVLLDNIREFFNNDDVQQLNPSLTALEDLITYKNGGASKHKPKLRKLLYKHILKIIQNLFTIIAKKSLHKKNIVTRNNYIVKSIKFNHKIHIYLINKKMEIRFVQKNGIITYETIRHHNKPFKYKKVYKDI
mgnify:CR=1 FL=1|tara:strand:- start:262 stop:687 length:426 start_codon:yes stop_codon:yes gene_type:complete